MSSSNLIYVIVTVGFCASIVISSQQKVGRLTITGDVETNGDGRQVYDRTKFRRVEATAEPP